MQHQSSTDGGASLGAGCVGTKWPLNNLIATDDLVKYEKNPHMLPVPLMKAQNREPETSKLWV